MVGFLFYQYILFYKSLKIAAGIIQFDKKVILFTSRPDSD